MKKAFTTKRVSQKENSDFSFANERREQTRLCGFTLIETLIAVTILSLSVAGPLTTASRAIVASQTARDHLTASYLAQEGIEYVRAMRDEEFLEAYRGGGSDVSNEAWTNFISGGGGSAGSIAGCKAAVCALDPTRPMVQALQPCSGGTCTPLYLTNCANTPSGRVCTPPNIYTQQNLGGSIATPFTRTIQAFDVSATDERIISTVSWSFHGTPYSVTVYDHLTPWQ